MGLIMAVNTGSSSLKFKLIEMPSEVDLCSGQVERIGFADAIVTIKFAGKKDVWTAKVLDHGEAVDVVLKSLIAKKVISSFNEIQACGHRIVQGGKYFTDSVVATNEVVSLVNQLAPLAPLHNPSHIVGYEAFLKVLGNSSKHVFVFDTAFHHTMPIESYLYPIPYEYYEKNDIRRYGFHGTSHLYVSKRAIELLGNPTTSNIITAHLGNGCSITAVKDGKSYKTSMGFTPLGGVVMGTRSGDIDPAIATYLGQLNLSNSEVDNILNKKSGLLGVSGVSSDRRDIIDAIAQGHVRAKIAEDLQVNSIVETIAGYIALLGGADAIVFTAGIGENDGTLRKLVVDKLSNVFGIVLDEEKNNTRGIEILISKPESKVKVYVIPTNEEVVIARDCVRLLKL
jgi:acetate kinase